MIENKILIVEDEFIEAMSFEQSLKSFGYDVVGIVTTGEDALKKVAEHNPDLILMDIVLKGEMDGIETAAKIKEDFDIPVIYLTAHPEDSMIQRAKLTSPYGYIIKPVIKIILKNTIEMALYKNKMEKKLREHEERLRVVFDSIEDLIFIKDKNLRYLEVNPAFEQFFRIKPEQIIGKTDAELFDLEDDEHNVIIDDRVLKNETITEKTSLIGPSNAIFEVIKSPMFNKKGEIIGLCGIARDITKLIHAEQALIISEDIFRAIAENSNNGILIADDRGNHIYVNIRAVEITGYSMEELLNSSIDDLTHSDEISKLIERYKAKVRGKSVPPTYKTHIVRKDKKVIPIEITAAKTVWNGKTSVMVIIYDILNNGA